jgi:hypothetical protein
MAHISVHVELNQFSIQKDNESSLDEPYIWPIYIKVDGPVVSESPDTAVLPMFAPVTGHGNIPHHVNDRIANPIQFTWESGLEPGLLALNPQLWKAGCFVIVAVAFLEQDASTDSDALAAHQAAINELQNQGNKALRTALVDLNFPNNFAVDQKALTNAIMMRMMPKKEGEFLLEGFIPFANFFFDFVNIASVVDPDDYVGEGYTKGFNVGELIGANPQGFPFSLSSGDQGEGKYRVDGLIKRSDTDEVPIIGLTGIGNNVNLYARNIEDGLGLFTSSDAGVNFEEVGRFSSGLFLGGPAACSSHSGDNQFVVGLGLDNQYYLASNHGLSAISEFSKLTDGTFKSAPAACCTSDGQWLHIVGRGTDDRYWHGFSNDFGVNVVGWTPIGDGTFRSAPAVVITPDGSRLLVFGLGTDNKLWRAYSHDHGNSWDLAWDTVQVNQGKKPEPTDVFTSAPAATISDDGKTVRVVCRTSNHTFWTTSSGDGGQTFFGYWSPLGGGTFYSAPAAVSDPTGDQLCVVGLGGDLSPWRCVYGRDSMVKDWSRVKPVTGFDMMYY